jgi:hypothetical protein
MRFAIKIGWLNLDQQITQELGVEYGEGINELKRRGKKYLRIFVLHCQSKLCIPLQIDY